MKSKIFLLSVPLLLCASTAYAGVTFNPLVIDGEDIIFSGHSDGPVDFAYLTGYTEPSGEIISCPDAGEYPPYTSSGGDFSYQIQNKPLPGDYACVMTATEWPLVLTGTVSKKYQWKVKPPFTSLFDPTPETVQIEKNIRLILRTSDPVQPLPNTPKSEQIEIYDSMGALLQIDDNYNPIINISYFSTPSDPRVVYDLKFPSTYTGTITIQPHPTNVVRQDGATLLDPVPYASFEIVDPPAILDGSGNVIGYENQEVPLLEQYLTGAMIDSKITSASPQTLGGALLDIRSMLIYFLIGFFVIAFLFSFRFLTRR